MQKAQQKHFEARVLRSVLAFAGLAGAIWALAGIGENDSDRDGWSDKEEILAETNPFDETEPWDSDGDGIADYLEFLNGTDPLDAGDPPKTSLAQASSGRAPLAGIRSVRNLVPTANLSPQPVIPPAARPASRKATMPSAESSPPPMPPERGARPTTLTETPPRKACSAAKRIRSRSFPMPSGVRSATTREANSLPRRSGTMNMLTRSTI